MTKKKKRGPTIVGAVLSVVDAVHRLTDRTELNYDDQRQILTRIELWGKTRMRVLRVLVGNVLLANDSHARPDAIPAGQGMLVQIDYLLLNGSTEIERILLQRPTRVHYDGRVWFEVIE